jgi:hypothetical protein
MTRLEEITRMKITMDKEIQIDLHHLRNPFNPRHPR